MANRPVIPFTLYTRTLSARFSQTPDCAGKFSFGLVDGYSNRSTLLTEIQKSRVGSLDAERLLTKARKGNPTLAANAAALTGAEANRRLADKTWYPDVTLGASAIQRPSWGPAGYQAWVSVKIPLQRGLHEGEIQQAASQANAAQARLDAAEQQIRGNLAEAIASYAGSRQTADLIRHRSLPQAEAFVRSSAASYAVNRATLETVLRSEHDLADIRLQLIAAEFDSQRQLAALERIIGGDL